MLIAAPSPPTSAVCASDAGVRSGMASSARNGIAGAVNDVADHARTLVRLEGELAALELRKKAAAFGGGAAALVGAVVVALFAFGFALATLAAGLSTFLPTWLSLLIVTLLLIAAVAILVVVGRALLRRATPPVPQQAIDEAKATGEMLKESRG
jgi:Putative Actinobacterial Holin-X, holin superfamily III